MLCGFLYYRIPRSTRAHDDYMFTVIPAPIFEASSSRDSPSYDNASGDALFSSFDSCDPPFFLQRSFRRPTSLTLVLRWAPSSKAPLLLEPFNELRTSSPNPVSCDAAQPRGSAHREPRVPNRLPQICRNSARWLHYRGMCKYKNALRFLGPP